MRPIKIKVCGITSLEELAFLDRLGIDYGGIWHGIKEGPSILNEAKFKLLSNQKTKNLKLVMVTIDTEASIIGTWIKNSKVKAVQLHGFQLPSFVINLRKVVPKHVEIFKVLHVKKGVCLEASLIQRYLESGVDRFIFDTFVSKERLGSTGQEIDLSFLDALSRNHIHPDDILLAGGIGESNVHHITKTVMPYGIDIDSAVKQEGKICHDRIQGLIHAIKDRSTSVKWKK